MNQAKSGLVDFHFHTNKSDGSETVASAIEEAKRRGVIALALTDHNTYDGIPVFRALCLEAGIEFLEGTEICAAFPETEWAQDLSKCGLVADVTILGRELRWKKFKEYKKSLNEYWVTKRLPQTLEKLRALGFKVPHLTENEIRKQTDIVVPPVLYEILQNSENQRRMLEICRDDFGAAITLKEIQKNQWAILNRYVYSIQGGAYVLRGPQEFGVSEAVDLAEQMGGVLFAAHPGGNYANWSINHLDYFIDMGGGGIEVWQYYHKPDQIRIFLEYAVRYRLLVSGGSDWHGTNGRPTLGCWDKPENQTPNWVARHLLERLP